MNAQTINKADLKEGFFLFGNKGNVWSNTSHIMNASGNLCGTPGLSSNWARIEDVQEAGCPGCIAKYLELTK